MTERTDKAALVTGASRGIGAAVARRLASEGFGVVVNYSRGSADAETLVREIEQAGGRAVAVQADVADPAGIGQLFDAAEQAFGGLDVLVNNAGVMRLAPVADTDDAALDAQLAVNLSGVFRGMREAARRLRDGGRIISFSSSVVGLYQPTYGVYAATKAGVEAMTHVLAKELGSRGITVNAVAPGPVATALFLDGKTDEQVEQLGRAAPLERLGRPEDIAETVAHLAGPARWIHGQTLFANGGLA
jgi:3-oxoacyl-[acyl-carrier protein] reductase